jgi:hypothetical protein
LLYGADDFAKVLEISTRCGQDSDCNPCTAAGVWGASRGFARIPLDYTKEIDAIGGEKFIFTNSSFGSAVDNGIARAQLVAKANGGRIENDRLIVVEQTVDSPPEVRDFVIDGQPNERITVENARWTFTGDWGRQSSRKNGPEMLSSAKGAEATIKFTGTGAIIVGPYVSRGGLAEVYLDGKLDRTVDVNSDDDRRVTMEDVWHRFNLPDGEHEIRVVVKGEPYQESKGSEVRIQSLVVFR